MPSSCRHVNGRRAAAPSGSTKAVESATVATRPGNLFADIPADLRDEMFSTLLATRSFRVERIVSRGHASPLGFWYDQPEHEWVLLISGAARVRFDGEAEAVGMKPGDHLLIPAGRRHRVDWTAPEVDTVWLTIHYAE